MPPRQPTPNSLRSAVVVSAVSSSYAAILADDGMGEPLILCEGICVPPRTDGGVYIGH